MGGGGDGMGGCPGRQRNAKGKIKKGRESRFSWKSPGNQKRSLAQVTAEVRAGLRQSVRSSSSDRRHRKGGSSEKGTAQINQKVAETGIKQIQSAAAVFLSSPRFFFGVGCMEFG